MSDDVSRDFIANLTAYLADLDAKISAQDQDGQESGERHPA